MDFTKSLLKKRQLYYNSTKDGYTKGLFDGGTSNTDILMFNINIPIAVKKDPQHTDAELASIKNVLYKMFKFITDKYGTKSKRFIGNENLHKHFTQSINQLKDSIPTSRSYFIKNLKRSEPIKLGPSDQNGDTFDFVSAKNIYRHLSNGKKLDVTLFHDKDNVEINSNDGKIKYYLAREVPVEHKNKKNHSVSIMGYTRNIYGKIDFLVAKQSWGREKGIFLITPNFAQEHSIFTTLLYDSISVVE